MFGRHAELERLRLAAANAARGRAEVVGIVGPAGIGKSTLLANVDTERFVVLRATGHEAHRHLPWSGVQQLLYPLLGGLTAAPAPQRVALEHVFAIADAPDPNVRFAAMAGVLSLIEVAAHAQPVAIVVDDAQWLDAATIEALSFVAMRLRDVPVLMMIASRELLDITAAVIGERIDLSGLALADSAALARQFDNSTSASTAAAVHAAAHGNPLAVLEIIGALTTEERRGVTPLRGSISSTGATSDLFRAKIASLPGHTRLGLALVALADPTSLSALDELLIAAGLTMSSIRPAIAERIIEVRPSIRWAHPLVRSVAVEEAPEGELRAAARAAAANVGDVVRRAWLLDAVEARPNAIAAATLEEAARSASTAGAHRDAGAAWERAADHATDPRRAAELRLAAYNAYMIGAAGADGLRCIRRLVSEAPTEVDRIDRLADQVVLSSKAGLGGYDPSIAETFVGSRSLNPAGAVRGLLACSQQAYMNAEIAPAHRLALLAGEVDPTSPAVVMTTELLDWFAGDRRPAMLVDMPWEQLIDTDEILTGELPIDAVIVLLCHVEQFDRAAALTSRLLQVIGERNAIGLLGSTLAAQAELALRRGEWTIARSALAEAADLQHLFGWDSTVPNAVLISAYLDAAQGHHQRCAEAISRARSIAPGTVPVLGFGLRAEAMNAHARSDAEAAAVAWEQLAELTGPGGMNPTGYGTWRADAAGAMLRLGRRDDAQRFVEALEQDAARYPWLETPQAAAMWARGIVDPSAGADSVLNGAAILERLGLRFDAARALLAAGEMQRRARQRGAAQQSLGRAHAVLSALEAAPWAAMAAREIQLCGGSPKRAPSTSGQLTSQEDRVAVLAAGGLSNAEVAARLFLSRRTVEYHLVNVYRKLGVVGRDALVQALADINS